MNIYLNNILTGTIETIDDQRYFCYNSAYLSKSAAIPLSLSLPLDPEPYSEKLARPFFDHISPELWNSDTALNLSIPGSLTFNEPDQTTPPFLELDISECETHLNKQSCKVSVGLEDSLSASQPKINVSIIDGELFNAKNDNDNTHILKGTLNSFDDIVGNEIFVSLIAYNLGIPVPMISRVHLGETPALVMDRPDRQAPSSCQKFSKKIHHESFISALSNQFLGPRNNCQISVENQFELLRSHAITPAIDCRTFIRVIALCLIAGCDDFSLNTQLIELLPNNQCRLAPLTGFISSDIYQSTTKNFLDYLFGIQQFSSLKKNHLISLADKIRINDKYLCSVIGDLSKTIPQIATNIFETFPALKSPTTLKVIKLIDQRSTTFKKMIYGKGSINAKTALDEAI